MGGSQLAPGAVAVPLAALSADDAGEGEEQENPEEGARGKGAHIVRACSNECCGQTGERFLLSAVGIFLENGQFQLERWDSFKRVDRCGVKSR